MLKKFAVMGNPIEHSMSPIIHQAFAEQFNIQLQYELILFAEGELKSSIEAFRQQNGWGISLTLPLKQEAVTLADELTPRAKLAGAVNTVIFLDAGRWRGDNTDGIGFIRDIRDNNLVLLTGKRILILGAGGAVRGILPLILAEQPKEVVIANRTLMKAQQLASEFATFGAVKYCVFQDTGLLPFDIVINGTSASTKGEALNVPQALLQQAVCYDLAYGKNAQPFLEWAKQSGARLCIDGAGMLVEQAAEQFYLWHNKKPETISVIRMISHD
jgi:shikimate dehydrogenase